MINTSPNRDTHFSSAVSRIASLDALRAVAVLGVLIYHLSELTHAFTFLPAALSWLPAMGMFGVDLFYVLSGFFIGNAVLRPSEWSAGHFFEQRVRRILPAYYFSLVILGVTSLTNMQGVVNFMLHLAMMHGFLPWTHGSINGVYWTLGVEFPFYILMLSIAPFYRDHRYRVAVCISMIALAILWRAGVFYSAEQNAWMRFFLSTQLLGSLDAFGVGCAAAVLLTKLGQNDRTNAIYYGWIAAILGLLITILCVHYFRDHSGHFWFDMTSAIFWRMFLSIGFCLILVSLAIGGGSTMLTTFTRWTGLSFIGKISFSIYLWHVPIILVVKKYCMQHAVNVISAGVPVILFTTFAAASLSFYFIERRFHRF
jgi:peptidoglycan/LPS O-acetylase OafA/YrhL